MTDIERLKKCINESGLTMVALAHKSGISRETLYNRLKGIGEFSASEITGLASALHLSKSERDAIFFAKKVELNAT